ncbi:MAG: hypothetical protein LQ350_007673 [Teloschistes chrysophthalmus]|nr:MAG: hypothetical protein LQ350_007673 [Niorma chrysophthalma]
MWDSAATVAIFARASQAEDPSVAAFLQQHLRNPKMKEVDVLIVGAGPVGLLTAYCLARYGLSTYIIEQHDRSKQTLYGRAAMIAPRTLEMFDQLDLVDPLLQTGFVVRGQVHYDKHGERIDVKRYASSDIKDTFFDFLLLCRQKYTEDVIHDGYKRVSGQSVHYGTKLHSYDISDPPNSDDYKVMSNLQPTTGSAISIKSKYIVGSDGARSTVRTLSPIAFSGSQTSHHFIRIDALVSTSMPLARSGVVGIESASHGSVLWACLDHHITRIGFAFPPTLWTQKGAQLTQEDVVAEAKEALQPFGLEFERVDWWTAYSVAQRLASTYRAQGRVLVAGDAAHTHSSAAAQGMNTGIHDAVNLSWKLAGYIKGWFEEEVLDSYSIERRGIAEKIIDQDTIVATLTAGEVPERYRDDPGFERSRVLSELYERNQALNVGLGINYPADACTIVANNNNNLAKLKVSPGERAPDTLVQRPGIRLPTRLHSLFKNRGKFSLMLMCGNPGRTAASLQAWHDYLGGPDSHTCYQGDLFQHLTIMNMPNEHGSLVEKLGIDDAGDAYFDVDGSAHERYGVCEDEAIVFILRPDGTIGCSCALPDTSAVIRYFAGFLKVEKRSRGEFNGDGEKALGDGTTGEVDIQVPNLESEGGH